MKKIKSFISGVINWFKVKIENTKLKKEIKELKSKIRNMQREIDILTDLTDKDLNVKRVKELRKTVDHQMEIKHDLRAEIKELKEKLKESK